MAIHTRKKNRQPEPRITVFVYGTLKRNYPLHDWLTGSKYLGVDTVSGFSLLDFGPYPAMIRMAKIDGQPDKGYQVSGELWSVPLTHFEKIREMEERVGYRTLVVETQGKTEAAAFVYGELTRAVVEWTKIGKETYVVQPIVVKDDLPF